jgi:amidohydrolase
MTADARTLAAEAQALLPRMKSWRRALHRWPELGFKERRTAALVARTLAASGWRVQRGVAKTGVVAQLRGSQPGPTFALRADMDALPIQEQGRATYRSRRAGIMHACGHDGNTAMLLGAALLLGRRRLKLRGNVKLIFQPCEETPPGGAQAMVRAGVLQQPRVAAIIAAHIDTSLPSGSVGLRPGPNMAAADAFTLTVLGRGGHGALPHRSVDAVVVAGQVISALQTIVAREQDPLEPAVVTIGQLQGGDAFNVIADSVRMRGTLRSLTPALRRELPRRVARVARGVCAALRARCRFELEPGHPPLANDPAVTRLVASAAGRVLGSARVRRLARPLMSGEDFTYFANRVPACFFHVGAGRRAPGANRPWHHPAFDFNEQALAAGAAVLAQSALDFLRA